MEMEDRVMVKKIPKETIKSYFDAWREIISDPTLTLVEFKLLIYLQQTNLEHPVFAYDTLAKNIGLEGKYRKNTIWRAVAKLVERNYLIKTLISRLKASPLAQLEFTNKYKKPEGLPAIVGYVDPHLLEGRRGVYLSEESPPTGNEDKMNNINNENSNNDIAIAIPLSSNENTYEEEEKREGSDNYGIELSTIGKNGTVTDSSRLDNSHIEKVIEHGLQALPDTLLSQKMRESIVKFIKRFTTDLASGGTVITQEDLTSAIDEFADSRWDEAKYGSKRLDWLFKEEKNLISYLSKARKKKAEEEQERKRQEEEAAANSEKQRLRELEKNEEAKKAKIERKKWQEEQEKWKLEQERLEKEEELERKQLLAEWEKIKGENLKPDESSQFKLLLDEYTVSQIDRALNEIKDKKWTIRMLKEKTHQNLYRLLEEEQKFLQYEFETDVAN